MNISGFRRNCHPDVVTATCGRRRRWIERQVVRKLEIRRRVHANFDVIINKRCRVAWTTFGFAQVDRKYTIITRSRNRGVQSIRAAAIVAG
jgi:hypothetical protein